MRSLLLGLLSTATVATVVLPATAAAAAKTIEWTRHDGDNVQLDVPKGWTVDVSDKGATVWIREEPGNKYKVSAALLRRRADGKTNALALAKAYVDEHEYHDIAMRQYVIGDKDHAVVIGLDQLNFKPARVGVRIDVDRKAGVMHISILRGLRGDFYSVGGLAFLDRMLTSRSAPAQRAEHYSAWDWELYRDEHLAVRKPKGWSIEAKHFDNGHYFIKMYDGETFKESTLGVILMRVRAPKNFKKVAKAPLAALHKMFPALRPLNPGEVSSYRLVADIDDVTGDEYRVAMLSKTSSEFVSLAFAMGEPDPFWQAGMIDMANGIHDSLGMGETGIVGAWLTGRASNLFEHYDSDGTFVRNSSTGMSMVLIFDAKGGYAVKYLYTDDYSSAMATWAEEWGAYTFDGTALTLTPERRETHSRAGSRKKTSVFKAKDLSALTLSVRIDPTRSGVVLMGAPGFERIGFSPSTQRASAKGESWSRLTFERVER